MNPFDFFEQIYCINLDSRTDRWEHAKHQFELMGMVDRVERVSGQLYKKTFDDKRNSCIGNHWSHAICLNKAKNFDNCLIFEDDVEFFGGAKDVLAVALEQLPDNWDMFYFGINMDQFMAYQVSGNIARLGGGFSTHAYAVKHTLYDKLIKLNLDEDIVHNDVEYSTRIMPRHNCYVTIPLIAGQWESYSDIEGKVISSNSMFLKRFSERLVRMKNVDNQA